jgi:WD40 repeat protein
MTSPVRSLVAPGGGRRRVGGPIAAMVVSGMLVGGCDELSRLLEDRLAAGAGLVTGEDVPAAPGLDGCNTRLGPTIGQATPTAFAADGPWQLCGTYGVGGAYIVKASADGRRVALLTDSGQVWVLDARTFRSLGTFAHGDGPISFAGLSPDGRTLATVDGPAGRVGLWDVESHVLLRTLSRPGAGMSYYGLGDVAFSRDGNRVAVVSGEHVDVFDTTTGAAFPISSRDLGGAMRVAFVAGDTRLVLGRFKYWGNGPYAGWGSVDLVDSATGDHLTHLDKDLHIALAAIAVSGDGRTLAVGASEPGTSPITFFDAATGLNQGEQASMGVPLGLDRAGARLAMLEPPPPADGSGGASAPALTVTVRRTSDGAVLSTVPADAGAPSSRRKLFAVTPELDAVLVGALATRALTRLNLATGREAAVACGTGHLSDVAALAISRDGQTLVSTGDSSDVTPRPWDVATGALLSGPPPGDLRQPSALSRDGKVQADAATSGASFFDLRDTSSGASAHRLGPQPTRPTTFDFAPDGSLVASASERDPADRQVAPVTAIWTVDGGDLAQTLPVLTGQPETSAQPVLFADDGRHLFVGGFASTALWCRSP